MTCTHSSTLGVYLLGALEPEDRSVFEAHLARCDVCRSELVRLAPLPGLLNQITLADFEEPGEVAVLAPESPVALAEMPEPFVIDLPPPPDPGPEQAPEPQRARRPYWKVAVAAALVLVLTLGGFLIYETLGGTPNQPPETAITWSAVSPDTGVRADARLIERSWGTEVWVRMGNVPVGERCKLVVYARGAAGEKETASWWGTPAQLSDEQIPGGTSFALSRIYKLEVVNEDGALLVDIHRPR